MQRTVSGVREKDVLPVSKSLHKAGGAPESKTAKIFLSSLEVFSLISAFFLTPENMLFDILDFKDFLPFKASGYGRKGKWQGELASGHCLPEQLKDLMPVASRPKDHFCIFPTMPTSPGHSKV